MVGSAANAQKACTKKAGAKCCASKKTAAVDAKTTQVASALTEAAITEADIAAEADVNISSRVCDISGAKAYYQKSVCAHSGSVAWEQVEFDGEAKKFTKVASASMEKDVETGEVKTMKAKKECKKGSSKACCAKKKSTSK